MKKEDQRTKITKMMIRTAFLNLLATKSIQSITVKEICENAEINRGTFYKHFLDVYDLKEKIENEFAENIIEALMPLTQNAEKETSLTEVIETVFQVIYSNADFSSLIISNHTDKKFMIRLLEIGYENYMAAYLKMFPNVDQAKLNYYYSFVSAGCIGILEKWLATGVKEDVGEIASIAEDIMMNGLEFLKRTP